MSSHLDADSIRAAIRVIRDDGAPAFTSDRYVSDIHPRWLATPKRRYQLWAMLERLHELERDER
jgi:hypothetical protein